MKMMRGAAAIKLVRAAQGKSGGGGGGSSQKLFISAGEAVPVRVYGSFEGDDAYPIYFRQHYVKVIGGAAAYCSCAMYVGDDSQIRLMEGHAGCAYCQLPDKEGGYAGPKAIFWVKDLRLQHKLEVEVLIPKVDGGSFKGKYPPCDGHGCGYCKSGNQAQARGWLVYEVSGKVAEEWLAQRAGIRNVCRTCGDTGDLGQGTLTVYGGYCTGCNGTWPGEVGTVCPHCHLATVAEWLSCPTVGCLPARADMCDFIWEIMVTGAPGKDGATKKSTSFIPKKLRPLTPAEIEEAEKFIPNWETVIMPEPLDMQLAKLPPQLAQAVRAKMGPVTAPPGHGSASD